MKTLAVLRLPVNKWTELIYRYENDWVRSPISISDPRVHRRPINSLTGLRFVAALCVVVSHGLPFIVKFPSPPLIISLISQTAAEGMSLFFVLSGFVMYFNYSHLAESQIGLRSFFVARFARLYPLYFVCLTCDLLIKLGYDQFPTDRLTALPFYVTLTQSWFYVPISGNALIYQFGHMPSVAWSISTEFFFYVAFPLVCLCISRLRTTAQKLVAMGAVTAFAIILLTLITSSFDRIQAFGDAHFGPIATEQQDSLFRWIFYFSPYTRIFEFVLGCLSASLIMTLPNPTAREQRAGWWAILFILASTAILHYLMFGVESRSLLLSYIHVFHMNFGFAPLAAGLIFCSARYQNGITSALSGKWIVLGGEASYSIYLLHFLIINAFRYEAATITSWNVAVGALVQFLIVLASIVGLALVSWRFIEVPSRIAIRRAFAIANSKGTETLPLSARPAPAE